jgi:hypothetical protein
LKLLLPIVENNSTKRDDCLFHGFFEKSSAEEEVSIDRLQELVHRLEKVRFLRFYTHQNTECPVITVYYGATAIACSCVNERRKLIT